MLNPVMALLNKTAALPQLFQTLLSASNPEAMIRQMAMTDPRMKQVQQVIDQNGSIQQAVYAVARQKGIDPQVALEQARQMLPK